MAGRFWIVLLLLVSFHQLNAQAESEVDTDLVAMREADADAKPYWEYGAGLGYVHYQHYPAANQFSNLLLPFPTFQYRGKIVRADDRNGAHIYLLKGHDWVFEMSGAGYPALDSSKNEARQGMEDLPWMLAIGPQFVYSMAKGFKLSLGAYQAASTDFRMTRLAGELFQGKLTYQWTADNSFGTIIFELKAASKEFLATYFQVPSDKATANRPAYEAREGLLSHQLTYFQAFKSGRAMFYIGGALENYSLSANRQSSLHKSDANLTYFIGLTYVLGESSKSAIPENETSGLVNRWRAKEPR